MTTSATVSPRPLPYYYMVPLVNNLLPAPEIASYLQFAQLKSGVLRGSLTGGGVPWSSV